MGRPQKLREKLIVQHKMQHNAVKMTVLRFLYWVQIPLSAYKRNPEFTENNVNSGFLFTLKTAKCSQNQQNAHDFTNYATQNTTRNTQHDLQELLEVFVDLTVDFFSFFVEGMLIYVPQRAVRRPSAAFHRVLVRDAKLYHHAGIQMS